MTELSRDVARVFDTLVRGPGVHIHELRNAVNAHLEEIERAAFENALLPVDLARRLAAALLDLIDRYPTLSEKQQPLVVGAARYFVSEEDARPDTKDVLGLDDDVAVFNHVVALLHLSELSIPL